MDEKWKQEIASLDEALHDKIPMWNTCSFLLDGQGRFRAGRNEVVSPFGVLQRLEEQQVLLSRAANLISNLKNQD